MKIHVQKSEKLMKGIRGLGNFLYLKRYVVYLFV